MGAVIGAAIGELLGRALRGCAGPTPDSGEHRAAVRGRPPGPCPAGRSAARPGRCARRQRRAVDQPAQRRREGASGSAWPKSAGHGASNRSCCSRGSTLVARAEAAVAGGADVIGMAGGDGSLALVAGVAARHQVPMVVVPAGTRNHLAMDLGLDRGDVVGALDAYGAAVERAVDLGDVNGRPFVNNVSLGLYAEIIRSPAYRDAKLDTTLSALPGLLGPGSRPFDLRFTDPAGERHTGAHVVQVSNNPYGRTVRTLGQPSASRLRSARGDHPGAPGRAARSGGPRRDRGRPPRSFPWLRRLGAADVRGGFRRSRRRRDRRRGAADEAPAAVHHPARRAADPPATACERPLARRP